MNVLSVQLIRFIFNSVSFKNESYLTCRFFCNIVIFVTKEVAIQG